MLSRGRVRIGFVFAISLGLHTALFLSFPRHVKPAPSLIEWVESPVAAVKSDAAPPPNLRVENRAARTSPDSNGDIVTSRKLQFAPSFKPAEKRLDASPQLTADGEPVDDPSAEWGSGAKEFARVSDLGRFDRLYDMIDAHVMYPSVLAYHGVSGTVNARLILTPKGTCDWHATSIDSTESHLRLYVLDVLKQVCKRDLSRFARHSANSNLDLSFKFAITEHDDETLKAREKKVVGNVFLFYRNSQQSVAEWHLGPFRGMFPLPTVSIDFVWLKENYDRVMHSRDPLKDFKSHLSQDPPS